MLFNIYYYLGDPSNLSFDPRAESGINDDFLEDYGVSAFIVESFYSIPFMPPSKTWGSSYIYFLVYIDVADGFEV
jgi:hypothetical protein